MQGPSLTPEQVTVCCSPPAQKSTYVGSLWTSQVSSTQVTSCRRRKRGNLFDLQQKAASFLTFPALKSQTSQTQVNLVAEGLTVALSVASVEEPRG